MLLAELDFNRDMAEAVNFGKARLVRAGRQRLAGHDRCDHRVVAGPQAPEMEIGDAVCAKLQALLDGRGEVIAGGRIEQNAASRAYQSPGPVRDYARTDDPHHWIHPTPAQFAA